MLGRRGRQLAAVYHHLRDKCRVTALDFPGHGRSGFPPEDGWGVQEYADFTADFIRALGLEGCDIVAHSFGCRVSIVLSAQQPELVGKLLLTGAAGLRKKPGPAARLRQGLYKGLKACCRLLPNGQALRQAAWRTASAPGIIAPCRRTCAGPSSRWSTRT